MQLLLQKLHDLAHKFTPLPKAERVLSLSSSFWQVLECLYSLNGKRCPNFSPKLLMASHCPFILGLT